MSDSTTSFNFKLIDEFIGYISAKDKTNVDDRALVRGSQNVYKKLSGTIASRSGMKRIDTADSTIAKIDSEFVWYTSWGRTYILRVANSKLQVYYNDTWFDLLTGLTKTRYIFDTWWNNTTKKDELLFVCGDSNIYRWSGGITDLGYGTTNTIVRAGSGSWNEEGFDNTGTVIISGTEYAYTGGASTNTITGVTPDASGVSGGWALQKVTTNTNKPASGFSVDFIKVVNNQVFCGSYTSRLCYVSKNTDYTDFTVPGTRSAGDPELLTLDQALKGITVRQGNAYIGAGTGYWYVITFNDITVGTTLTQQTKVDRKPVANLAAPLGHEFIDVVGDTIVYLSQDQQLRTFGDYRNLFEPAYPSLSQPVHDELQGEDFTGGHVKAIGDFIYLTAPLNGKVYLHQTRQSVDAMGNVTAERLWHPPQIWNITRVDEVDGVVYGFSNANPQMYQLWDTGQWHDDSPSDEPLPYTCIIAMAYRNHGRRQGLISFDKIYTEGYISPGTDLNLRVKYDYQGSKSLIETPINSSDRPVKTFSGSNAPSIGDSSIGDNPLGDGLTEETSDQDLLPKFRCINSLTLENIFEYQVVIYSEDADSRWEILCLGSNVELETEQQATFIINKSR